jgi:voltage-gated potassium channel
LLTIQHEHFRSNGTAADAISAGYVMRLSELGLGDFAMMDSMWVLLLSTTTVGYGDLYPVTDAGRVVLVLNQILGVVVLSTLVAVLQSTLSLSNRYEHHP